MCIENDIDVMLKSYFTYDDDENNAGLIDGNMYPGYRNMLQRISDGGKKIAEEKNVYCADLYSYMRRYSDEFLKENPDYNKTVFTAYDRIHQSAEGQLLDAVMIAKYNGVSDSISEVSIDVTGEASSENADIAVIDKTRNAVSYEYSPKALPVYTTRAYKKLNNELGVNIEDMINREIVKIENLESGSYTIFADGAELGVYTAEELSNGVNIAECENNPGRTASKAVYDKLMKIPHQQFRDIAAITHVLSKIYEVDVTDDDAVRAFVEAHPDGVNYSGSYPYTYEQLSNYLEQRETEAEQYAQILTIQQEAKELAKAGLKTYTITVEKN